MKEVDQVDLGSIKIHKKVLADIAHSVVTSMDGVRLTDGDPVARIGRVLGLRAHPGIQVTVDRDNQVTVELTITVSCGLAIPDVARHVQDRVREEIEKTVDIPLKDVNVGVHGIERGES